MQNIQQRGPLSLQSQQQIGINEELTLLETAVNELSISTLRQEEEQKKEQGKIESANKIQEKYRRHRLETKRVENLYRNLLNNFKAMPQEQLPDYLNSLDQQELDFLFPYVTQQQLHILVANWIDAHKAGNDSKMQSLVDFPQRIVGEGYLLLREVHPSLILLLQKYRETYTIKRQILAEVCVKQEKQMKETLSEIEKLMKEIISELQQKKDALLFRLSKNSIKFLPKQDIEAYIASKNKYLSEGPLVMFSVARDLFADLDKMSTSYHLTSVFNLQALRSQYTALTPLNQELHELIHDLTVEEKYQELCS